MEAVNGQAPLSVRVLLSAGGTAGHVLPALTVLRRADIGCTA